MVAMGHNNNRWKSMRIFARTRNNNCLLQESLQFKIAHVDSQIMMELLRYAIVLLLTTEMKELKVRIIYLFIYLFIIYYLLFINLALLIVQTQSFLDPQQLVFAILDQLSSFKLYLLPSKQQQTFITMDELPPMSKAGSKLPDLKSSNGSQKHSLSGGTSLRKRKLAMNPKKATK
jgi:hypothetical protein